MKKINILALALLLLIGVGCGNKTENETEKNEEGSKKSEKVIDETKLTQEEDAYWSDKFNEINNVEGGNLTFESIEKGKKDPENESISYYLKFSNNELFNDYKMTFISRDGGEPDIFMFDLAVSHQNPLTVAQSEEYVNLSSNLGFHDEIHNRDIMLQFLEGLETKKITSGTYPNNNTKPSITVVYQINSDNSKYNFMYSK